MEEYCNDNNDLSALIDNYGNSVLNTAYLFLKDRQLAEDIFQEVFLTAYLKINTFEFRSSIKTWLIRITINLCKDTIKCAYTKKVTVGLDVFDSTDNSTEDTAIKQIENERLYNAVMSLKPDFRDVILLRYYNQFSLEEISSVLHISNGLVRTRLTRAVSKLKKVLTD